MLDITKLQSSINNLLYSLTLSISKLRINSYHNTITFEPHLDITPMLLQEIDNLATNIKQHINPENNQQDNNANPYSTSALPHAGPLPNTNSLVSNDGLAKQLDNHATSNKYHETLSAKLKNHSWEHIHSALRFARQGDKHNAYLHAQLAGECLHQAMHFLPENEQKTLSEEMHGKLGELIEPYRVGPQ